MVASADVGPEDQMRAVVDAATKRFGAIHGVIHAAGVAGGGIMSSKRQDGRRIPGAQERCRL